MDEIAKDVKDYWQLGVMIFMFALVYYNQKSNTSSIQEFKKELSKIIKFMHKSEVKQEVVEKDIVQMWSKINDKQDKA